MTEQYNYLVSDIPLAERMAAEIATLQSLRPAIIAIDGPAGAGKSTIGHQLAQLLDFLFFDTGIMYRAITCAALTRNLDLTDAQAMGELTQRIDIDIIPIPPEEQADVAAGTYNYVHIDGVDITNDLRTTAVNRNVSTVSAHVPVRQALSDQQRRIGRSYGEATGPKRGIVMAGRDIGTVVLPDAPLKVFMIASLTERARRRYCEQRKKGSDVTLSQLIEEIERRDRIDSERDSSPLIAAEDAIELDTSDLTTDEVVEAILDVANDLL